MSPTSDSQPSQPSAARSSQRYRRIATLGQGGMARVNLTVSRSASGVDKLLVVKELRAELASDPEFLTMFMDEARIAARLNHPNVIQTYEVSAEGDQHVIVMEFLEGQPLNVILARATRKNMPLELHLRILSDALAGLHYAHELADFDGKPLSIVHRDVSPHNLFVTYAGQVKLVDFGIAKAVGSSGATRTGVFKGKIGYAAPEQLVGAAVDRRTDIFAMGVMIWEAVAKKRRAQPGQPDIEAITRRVEGRETNLLDAAPDAPPELVAICEKALAVNPEDRYATAADLREDVDRYLEGKRAGQADLAKLITTTFAEDRLKMRGLIEAGIKSLEAPAPAEPIVIDAPVASSSEPSGSSRSVNKLASSPSFTAPAAEAPRLNRPRSPLAPLLIVGAIVAAGALVFAMRAGSHAPPPPMNATTAPTAAETATAAPTATADATVQFAITVDPPDAKIFLDDAALGGNPFRGAMPKSQLAKRLRVTANGYVTEERLLVLDRDAQLEIALKRAEKTAVVVPAQPNVPGPRHTAATADQAPTAPTPHPTAAPTMGADLSPGSKKPPQHPIDDHL